MAPIDSCEQQNMQLYSRHFLACIISGGPDELGFPRRRVHEALLNGVCGPCLLRAMSSLYMQQRPLVFQCCLTPPLCPQMPIRRACAPRLQRQLRKGGKRSLEVSAQAVAIEDATTINAQAPKVKDSKKKVQDLSPEVAKDLYRDMFLGREFEEMCAQMYYRGKMFGFVHLYSGQEAVSTGETAWLASPVKQTSPHKVAGTPQAADKAAL